MTHNNALTNKFKTNSRDTNVNRIKMGANSKQLMLTTKPIGHKFCHQMTLLQHQHFYMHI